MIWSSNNGIGEMMAPNPWQGKAEDIPFAEYQWLKNLRGRAYCKLFEQIPGFLNNFYLPDGYDLYVISFHLEAIDIKWVDQVSKQINKPIIVLGDAVDIQYPAPGHVHFYTFIYWHHQLTKAMTWFNPPDVNSRQITHKASAICNRITQSKLLITLALLENLGADCMIRLSSRLELKNVHHRQNTGNRVLDELMDIYWQKYHGKEIKLDDFVDSKHNYQAVTANFNQPYLQNVAVHFTNETLAYSFMSENDREYLYPGPFLTEKTLKCLIGAVALIPVGQFNTLGALRLLGLKFDYGFDTSWDSDPGNLSRLESIIKLIQSFRDIHAIELYEMTKESVMHNHNHVWSGSFSRACESLNQFEIQRLLKDFG